METTKHKVSGEIFPPIQVKSDKNTQTIINGEKITFKKGDDIELRITHMNVPDCSGDSFEWSKHYSYDIELTINGVGLGLTRSIMHTMELLFEISKLENNG